MVKKFWIADDDPDDRLIIREAFEEFKFENSLSFFEDGEMVILKFKEQRTNKDYPALLILDLNMPKMNGLELLTRVKSDLNIRHIPVVILSTSKSIQDKEKVLKLGADEFITKPFSFDLMLEITKGLIEKYG